MSKQILFVIHWFLVLALCPIFVKAQGLEYSKLQMRDLDQMRSEVNELVAEARQNINDEDKEQATSNLKRACILIFSRPNGDNMVSILFSEVKAKLKDLEAYESTLENIIDHTIKILNDAKEKPAVRATQVIILENIMSELKPEIKNNEKVKALYVKIRDAKIKIPSAVKNDFLLKGQSNNRKSPSKIAEDIIGK